MNRLVPHVLSMAAIAALRSPARAADPRPPVAPPAAAAPAATTTSTGEATPALAEPPAARGDAGDTEGEAIEIFDQRPDKPFDRDT